MWLLSSLLLFLSACQKEASLTSEDPVPAGIPTTLNRTLMLQLVNDARKKGCQCGDTYYYPAAPLVWHSQLETAAAGHSADMYYNNYFAHQDAQGRNGGYRITQAGYVWKAFGENIASGYKTEKEVVDGWLKSPGHCKNIMSSLYKEVGVARVGTVWTQNFGMR